MDPKALIESSVDALRMHRDGHTFYRSANGVWLTERVPPQYVAFPTPSAKLGPIWPSSRSRTRRRISVASGCGQSARWLEREHPDLVVSSMKKDVRAGKVLVDWSQNGVHKTTVCVWSMASRLASRARRAASTSLQRRGAETVGRTPPGACRRAGP